MIDGVADDALAQRIAQDRRSGPTDRRYAELLARFGGRRADDRSADGNGAERTGTTDPQRMTEEPTMTRLAEVKAERDAAQRTANLYLTAVNLISREQPTVTETVKLGDDYYVLEVYGADRADGGVLVHTFQHPGQADSVSVDYFDSWRADVRSRVGHSAECTAFAIAADRLTLAIQEAQRRATA